MNQTGTKNIAIRFVVSFCMIMVVFMVVAGCKRPASHKSLSFFFDGVPDPEQVKAAKREDSLAKTLKFTGTKAVPTREAIAQAILHPPYRAKQCAMCHDKGALGKSDKSQTTTCYQCHDNFSDNFAYVHGPVAAGYCTMCHNPHMADNKEFLIRKGRDLCILCHDNNQITRMEAHQDIADANCTECHDPHGGKDQTMLK